MRLNEFVNQKVINELAFPETFKGAVDRLKSAGYNSLGSGYYGQVFEKPGADYVLKVFSNRDKAYTEFVNLVKSNSNDHFPKFRGDLVKINDAYSAIRMEKLNPNTDEKIASYLDYYISDGKTDYDEYFNGFDEEEADDVIYDMFESDPSLRSACNLIKSKLAKKFNIDIHDDNIMWRGTTPVIIDPAS